jgi:hypothetical protein
MEEQNAPKKSILLQGMDDVEDQDINIKASAAAAAALIVTNQLIPQIVTPSPFQLHNDSGTADRYRSALQRITSAPTRDVEAWEAIMNECMSLYRTQLLPQLDGERNAHKMILQSSAPNASLRINRAEELEKKLDWVESCHGHLTKFFPYSSNYYITAVEMLLARSALPFESLTGGEDDFTFGNVANWIKGQTSLQAAAGKKLDAIFELALGVKMDGTLASDALDNDGDIEMEMDEDEQESSAMQVLSGMCSSSIELWLLYIRKRTRDAKRQALQYHSTPTMDPMNPSKNIIKLTQDGENLIRDWIVTAYETALAHGAAFAFNNHSMWKQYLNFVKAWNIMVAAAPSETGQDTMPGINHSLHSKQKELLRGVYQRIITLPMLGLDGLWKEYETFERAQSEQLAAALIEENLPKYQHARSVYLERNRVYTVHDLRLGRLATTPVDYEFVDIDGNTKEDIDEEEYKQNMKVEIDLLAKWKRRCGYERSNPERLSTADLTIRIRQCYKDTVCCFMRHIEVWHEWSTWELLNAGGVGSVDVANTSKQRNASLATGVLQLGQKHVPDSTLLAYAHAQILESQLSDGQKGGSPGPGDEAIEVMLNFCGRTGNTLGFVLLQRLVRQYKGMKDARAVFSQARRKLRMRAEDIAENGEVVGKAEIDAQGDGTQAPDESIGLSTGKGNAAETASASKMVMNRSAFSESAQALDTETSENVSPLQDKATGFITWHLYASHASIEHRLNQSPKIASRVYELGLKKHRSFLSTPQYVLQYSSLLLELNDEENLRALLIRAISACEEENENDTDDAFSGDNNNAAAKRELQRPLWDMMLKFESILSMRSGDLSTVQSIEARRRKALYGPSTENVAGGSASDDVGIGIQKASLSETLIRSDGYEHSSRIVNGLSRLVDSLEVIGVLGQESIAVALSAFASFKPGSIWRDDGCSGQSDASYRRRKLHQTEISSLEKVSIVGSGGTAGMVGTAGPSGRLSSAKERLAQSAALNHNTSVMASVQGSPQWLRGMLMLLPATIRNYRGKAPPHMIEMALATLRGNPLPAARPSDEPGKPEKENGSGTAKRARSNMNDYSSDEETFNSGGYGSQFRARQRARLAKATS